MPEQVLQWLNAGAAPIGALAVLLLWRLERRVYRLELLLTAAGVIEGEGDA